MRDIVSFSAFAAIIVLVLGYFGTLGIRVNPPAERTELSMNVPDVNGIVAGSNVLLRGVPVGKVTGIGTTTQAATIDFYVEARYEIPLDSEIRLENLSALGESYIGLMPHSTGGPMLRNGQRIAAEAVTQPPSISELATSVVRVLNQLEPGSLERVIDETDEALPDPAAVLPNLARASTLLNNTVNDFRGRGRAVYDNVQTLLENAQYVAPALTSLSPDLKETGVWFQDLAKHFVYLLRRNEPQNVYDFNKFIKRVQEFLDARGPDLKVLGEALLPKLNTISAALMNFDTSQILDNMLAAVPPDGTVTLRVTP
jgi:virulence factor Mce-like protein